MLYFVIAVIDQIFGKEISLEQNEKSTDAGT